MAFRLDLLPTVSLCAVECGGIRGKAGITMRGLIPAALAAAVAIFPVAAAQAQTAGPRAPAAVAPTAKPAAAQPAFAKAAVCKNTGDFNRWLDGFKKEAVAEGITARTMAAAAPYLTLDQNIIWTDRGQRFFAQSFLDFSDKLASRGRFQNGVTYVARHKALFARAEKEYGVPAAVITAFWALESDFGAGMGNKPVLRSLATLAYDCRRGEMFRGELMAALKIIDRGDLVPAEMIGSWAGELGQTQFLPRHYLNHAVDWDGDGRRNLMRSPADIIGSTAAFIKSLEWQTGQPWLQEVRVPAILAWDQADLAIQHPRSQWAKWGVTAGDGSPLATDAMPASLVLMMGRNGPAFLAYPNFQIYLKWNQSLTYAVTAAYLATRIEGAPAMNRGRSAIPMLPVEQVMELQTLLNKRGYPAGDPDGKLGAGSRAAIKAAQVKFGLPADSYPTAELLEKLRRAN
jgi:lytic murein transglycosylase